MHFLFFIFKNKNSCIKGRNLRCAPQNSSKFNKFLQLEIFFTFLDVKFFKGVLIYR